jgi:hypothetical protein
MATRAPASTSGHREPEAAGGAGDQRAGAAELGHALRSVVAPREVDLLSPSLDESGIEFGPFAGGTDFQGAYSCALKDVRLRDIALLTYSTRYTGGGGTGAAPYIIIATDANGNQDNHVM